MFDRLRGGENNAIDSTTGEQRVYTSEVLIIFAHGPISDDEIDSRAGVFQQSRQTIAANCRAGHQKVQTTKDVESAGIIFQSPKNSFGCYLLGNDVDVDMRLLEFAQ